MTVRVTIAKAFVNAAEVAVDVADRLLRREAKVAFTKIDNKLLAAQATATAARQRAQAAEMRANLEHAITLGKLNEKLEVHSYAIPAGRVQ